MTTGAVEPAWTVPGYDVIELLGFGASGEVWLAREVASGESVALKRLRTPRDLAARDRLRREAAVLACLEHPHLVRLRTLVSSGDDLVLVLDHAAGGSLEALLATRRLGAGEVVTVAVPLAEALAAVHAQGIVHGDVTPANVLFTADGRPLLSDLGVCRLVGERMGPGETVAGTAGYLDPADQAGASPGTAGDVHGLAAVCLAALTGRAPYEGSGERRALLPGLGPDVPPVLVAVLERALDPDPLGRPGALEFAAAMFDACPALPVGLARGPGRDDAVLPSGAVPAEPAALTHEVRVRTAAADEPRVSDGTRRARRPRRPGREVPRWRTALVVLFLLCGLSVAVLTGVLWAGTDGRGGAAAIQSRQAATAPPPADDWTGVLRTLDRSRSRAFAEGDPVRLAGVYASGSPALARDQSVLAQLLAADHTARGVRLLPTSVNVQRRTDREVVLDVVDVMPPYDLVADDGAVSSTRPGRQAAPWSVTLVREGSTWRVFEVHRR